MPGHQNLLPEQSRDGSLLPPSTSPSRMRRGASGRAIDFSRLMFPSPENATSDRVPTQLARDPAMASATPSASPATSSLITSHKLEEVASLNKASTASDLGLHQVESQSCTPLDGSRSLEQAFPRPSGSGTGIFRKVVDVWRIQPPGGLEDEEAAVIANVEKPAILEIRYHWKQVVSGEEQSCVLKTVNGINGELSGDSEKHLLWM
jgi:hypothetical protein